MATMPRRRQCSAPRRARAGSMPNLPTCGSAWRWRRAATRPGRPPRSPRSPDRAPKSRVTGRPIVDDASLIGLTDGSRGGVGDSRRPFCVWPRALFGACPLSRHGTVNAAAPRHAPHEADRWSSLYADGMGRACASTTAFRRCLTHRSPTRATARCAGANSSTCCRGLERRDRAARRRGARPRPRATPSRSTNRSARRPCAALPAAALPPELLRIFAAQPVRIAAPLFAGLTHERTPRPRLILADADAEVRALVDDRAAPPEPDLSPNPPHPSPPHPSPNRPHPRSAPWSTASSNSARNAPPPKRKPPRATPPPRAHRRRRGRACSNGKATPPAISPGSTGAPRGALVGRPLGGDGVGLLERRRRRGLASATRSSMSRWRSATRLTASGARPACPPSIPRPAASSAIAGSRGASTAWRRRPAAQPAARNRPRRAARDGPRDQDPAQRDHRLCRDHRRPISRPRASPLPRARGEHRRPGAAIARGGRGPRLRRQAARRPQPRRRGGSAPRRPASADRRRPRAMPRGRAAACSRSISRTSAMRCALSPELAERLLRRLLLSLCEHVGRGEVVPHRGIVGSRHVPADHRPPALARRARGDATGRPGVRPAATADESQHASASASRCGWCADWPRSPAAACASTSIA